MRISVQHTETFTYEEPSMGTIQVLRMTPRDHNGHYVCDWNVDIDANCDLKTSKDAFGNVLTSFSLSGPLEQLTITATGEVETEETHGIIKGTAQKVPDGVFLRPSHSEHQAALVRTLMNAAGDASGKPLDHMHRLMGALHLALPSDDQTAETGEARQQQAAQHQAAKSQSQEQAQMGDNLDPPLSAAHHRLSSMLVERELLDASDISALFCDAARRYGLPARMVAGYRLGDAQTVQKDTQDIWAEVLIDELGWVAFDPIHKNCPSEESIRVAIGLDATGIAATRLGHYGGPADFTQSTSIAVRQIRG